MNQSYQYGLLFTQAHGAVRGRIYDILGRYQLTPTHWSILSAAFNAQDGIRLAKVARQLGVKAPLVTMLSNDLIKQGLIIRVPHQTDGRAKLLMPTTGGKKLAVEVESTLDKEIRTLMQDVTMAEAKAFKKTLEKILLNASKSGTRQL